jgi:hypothetical protein
VASDAAVRAWTGLVPLLIGVTALHTATPESGGLSSFQSSQRAQGFALDRDGRALVPPPRQPPRNQAPVAKPKGLEILARLADKLGDQDGQADEAQPLIVDAENAGKMLGVTPRTARRLLRTLVEEGLAWPLPPNRTPQPGRPRQLYRLIVEKLGPKTPT